MRPTVTWREAEASAPPRNVIPRETLREELSRRHHSFAWLAQSRGALVLCAVVALAGLTRFIGVASAVDLIDDEVDYSVLGDSLRHGVFPPRFGNVPFLLHPPLYFALEALWGDLTNPSTSLVPLIVSDRRLNALLAVITAALVVLFVRRLAGLVAGATAGVLFVLDPFIIQVNGQNLIETSVWVFLLAGWYLTTRALSSQSAAPARHPALSASLGGLLLGLGLVTKDIALIVIFPPLLIAIWRRWASRRLLALVALCAVAPTGVYLAALSAVGSLGAWWAQESFGIKRILGIAKITGFGVGGHPTVFSTLLRRAPLYGSSYLICALGLLGALYLIVKSAEPGRRLLGAVTLAGACTLVYATFLGTVETEMFYYPALPALMALPVALAECRVRLDREAKGWRQVVAVGLGALVVFDAYSWAVTRLAPDDGVTRLSSWFVAHDKSHAVIANDNDVVQFVLAQRGFRAVEASTPAVLRAEHVQFVTIFWPSVLQHYSSLSLREANWYRAHGTLRFQFTERSYGTVSVYQTTNQRSW